MGKQHKSTETVLGVGWRNQDLTLSHFYSCSSRGCSGLQTKWGSRSPTLLKTPAPWLLGKLGPRQAAAAGSCRANGRTAVAPDLLTPQLGP